MTVAVPVSHARPEMVGAFLLHPVMPARSPMYGGHVQAKYPASAYRGVRADIPDWLIGVPYARYLERAVQLLERAGWQNVRLLASLDPVQIPHADGIIIGYNPPIVLQRPDLLEAAWVILRPGVVFPPWERAAPHRPDGWPALWSGSGSSCSAIPAIGITGPCTSPGSILRSRSEHPVPGRRTSCQAAGPAQLCAGQREREFARLGSGQRPRAWRGTGSRWGAKRGASER
jgi:hypothetical protein